MENFIFLCSASSLEDTRSISKAEKSNQSWKVFESGTVIFLLTYQIPVLHSYRNQSIDLHSKSIDWFLYECNTDI